MAKSNGDIDIIKKGHSKDFYNLDREEELARCAADPVYFIQNYIRVQHPIKGRVPFELYPFQEEMVNAFHNHKDVIALCARQMGKSLHSSSIITRNSEKVNIGSLLRLTFRQKIVEFLESLLVKLVVKAD